MVATIRTDVDAAGFRSYGLGASSITYASQAHQLVASALGNLARYCPKGGRVTLAISWVPAFDGEGEDEYLLPPAMGLGDI